MGMFDDMKTSLLRRSNSMGTRYGQMSAVESVSFLSKRGHSGPVRCVGASKEVDFIVSGGDDYTMKIWRYVPKCMVYVYHGEVVHERPRDPLGCEEDEERPVAEHTHFFSVARGFVEASCRGCVDGLKSGHKECHGVTAVAVACSRVTALAPDDVVVLQEDDTFVVMQMEDVGREDCKWEDGMEDLCGREGTVFHSDGKVVIVHVNGVDVCWPTSCVERKHHDPMRDGPMISGTSEGDLVVLCMWSDEGEGRLETRPKLHQGKINSLCVVEYEIIENRVSFLLLTASDDGTAALLKLECVEVTPTCLACGGTGCPHCWDKEQPLEGKTCLALESVSEPLTRLEHRDASGELTPVLEAKSVGDKHTVEDRATFATLAVNGAHLWSSTGTHLMTLTISHKLLRWKASKQGGQVARESFNVERYSFMASVNKASGSLLFLGGKGNVAVWAIVEGAVLPRQCIGWDTSEREGVWRAEREKWETRQACPPPTAGYKQYGKLLDIDQSGSSTTFAVDVRQSGRSIMMWNLEAVAPTLLSLEPNSPSILLVMSGKERIELVLPLSSKVLDTCVVEDPDDVGGPALLVGCKDGSVLAWDLEGWNKGQMYAEMRSLSLREVLTPMILLFVGTLQIVSFGFSHPVKWPHTVQAPTMFVKHIVLLDWAYTFRIDFADWYLPEIEGIVMLIIFFIVSVLCDVDGRLNKYTRALQNTDTFKSMEKTSAEHKRQNRSRYNEVSTSFGGDVLDGSDRWAHRITNFLLSLSVINTNCSWISATAWKMWFSSVKIASYVVTQTKWLCSTMLLVPMLKIAMGVFDCVETPEGLFATKAPKVRCFEGLHLNMSVAVLLLVPPFIFFLVPYAVVEGDSKFCPRSATFHWRIWRDDNHWRACASRMATQIDMGFQRPHPSNVFSSRLVDVVQKVLLPLIFMPMVGRNFSTPVQLALAVLVTAVVVQQTVKYPPMLQEKYQRVIVCIKILTLAIMCIAFLTSVIDNVNSYVSLVLLCLACVAVSAYMIHGLVTIALDTQGRKRWEVAGS